MHVDHNQFFDCGVQLNAMNIAFKKFSSLGFNNLIVQNLIFKYLISKVLTHVKIKNLTCLNYIVGKEKSYLYSYVTFLSEFMDP